MATVVHQEPRVLTPAGRTPAGAPQTPPGRSDTSRRRKGGGNRNPVGLAWGLLVPALLIVAVVSIFPIVYAVNLSVHSTHYLNIGVFNGLDNYAKLFATPEGLAQIGRSFIYVIASLCITVPLSLGLANLLNQEIAGRRFFRVLILLPWVISQTVAALTWKWLVNADYGPFAHVGGSIDLLANPVTAMGLLIVVNVWISYPLATILSLASLQTIPAELREAAEMDGAGPFRRFTQVVLPLMKPTLFVVAIMLTLLYFNMVTLVYTLTGGGPLNGTNVLSLEAFKQSFQFFNVGVGAAYSVVLFLFNVIFGAAYIRLLRNEAHD